jgi:hypothetical protein
MGEEAASVTKREKEEEKKTHLEVNRQLVEEIELDGDALDVAVRLVLVAHDRLEEDNALTSFGKHLHEGFHEVLRAEMMERATKRSRIERKETGEGDGRGSVSKTAMSPGLKATQTRGEGRLEEERKQEKSDEKTHLNLIPPLLLLHLQAAQVMLHRHNATMSRNELLRLHQRQVGSSAESDDGRFWRGAFV